MKNLKKIFAAGLMVVLVAGSLAGCGKAGTIEMSGDENTTGQEILSAVAEDLNEGEVTAAAGDFAGTYAMEDSSELTIGEDGSVTIGIFRLAEFEGTAGAVEKGIMPIDATDPNGNAIGFEFNTETKELIVVDSTWDLLENGTAFVFDK